MSDKSLGSQSAELYGLSILRESLSLFLISRILKLSASPVHCFSIWDHCRGLLFQKRLWSQLACYGLSVFRKIMFQLSRSPYPYRVSFLRNQCARKNDSDSLGYVFDLRVFYPSIQRVSFINRIFLNVSRSSIVWLMGSIQVSGERWTFYKNVLDLQLTSTFSYKMTRSPHRAHSRRLYTFFLDRIHYSRSYTLSEIVYDLGERIRSFQIVYVLRLYTFSEIVYVLGDRVRSQIVDDLRDRIRSLHKPPTWDAWYTWYTGGYIHACVSGLFYLPVG